MFFQCSGKNQDVIQVHVDKPVQEVRKRIINESFAHRRGVSEAKRHHQVLIVPPMGPLVSLLNPNEMVEFHDETALLEG